MRKPKWDTELGRQMWLSGKTDEQIAVALGTTARAVNLYKYRNWVQEQKLVDMGIQGIPPELPAVKPSAPQRQGKTKEESMADIKKLEEAFDQKHGGSWKAAPLNTGSAKEPAQDISKDAMEEKCGTSSDTARAEVPASEGMLASQDVHGVLEDAMRSAAPFNAEGLYDEIAKGGVVGKFPAVRIETMDVLAMATEHLQGISAVCTASALQSLLFWRYPEDLMRARESIDYLLKRLECGGRYGK